MDNEHTVTTESVSPEGYARRVTRNKQSGRFAEPLTVIEFSLTNEVKKRLKEGLDPFIEGTKTVEKNGGELKKLIEDNLPKEVLEYFRELNTGDQESIAPYAYVVRNLPEVNKSSLKKGTNYATYIGRGVALATELVHAYYNSIARFSDQPDINIQGGEVHKHQMTATILNGVYQKKGAHIKTRITDLIGAISPRFDAQTRKKYEDKLYSYEPNHYSDNMALRMIGGKKRLQQFSQEIELGKGDMALWCERGRIFHEALPAEIEENAAIDTDKHSLIRYAIFHALFTPREKERPYDSPRR